MRYIYLLLFAITISSCNKAEQPRIPSASPQVLIERDSVYITSLDRYRTIRLYLPKSYASGEKQYPVLYMHDGQNLFDDVTSYVGEWGVDEVLDSLSGLGLEMIVVGIDNGQMLRMSEYGPWDNEKYGKAEGKEYVQFIVEELKPMIDEKYRTLTDGDHTAIMGSSMGGLISHYAAFQYPQVFHKIGIFSPSYWYAEEIWDFTLSRNENGDQRVYLLVGEKEGSDVVRNVRKMEDLLKESGFPEDQLSVVVDPEGKHTESFWRKHFAESIVFLFSE